MVRGECMLLNSERKFDWIRNSCMRSIQTYTHIVSMSCGHLLTTELWVHGEKSGWFYPSYYYTRCLVPAAAVQLNSSRAVCVCVCWKVVASLMFQQMYGVLYRVVLYRLVTSFCLHRSTCCTHTTASLSPLYKFHKTFAYCVLLFVLRVSLFFVPIQTIPTLFRFVPLKLVDIVNIECFRVRTIAMCSSQ